MADIMGHEDKTKYDQIADRISPAGITCRSRVSGYLFTSFFAPYLHPASIIRYSGLKTVSQDRLQGNNTDAAGLLGFTQSSGSQEDTLLLDSVLCRTKADKKRALENLLGSIFRQAHQTKLIEKHPRAAIDATGLETRYTSQHFIRCRRRGSFYRRRWPKLTIVCDIKTHLIAGCIVTRGPSMDFPNLPKVMKQAQKYVHFDQVLADAGYDSETNHIFCREELKIRSTVIAYNPRRSSKLPTAKYRRQMATEFDRSAYGDRWHVECVFSRHKRLLGSALRNRTADSRKRECLLRVLTHNLMILRRAA
jgi:transposase